MSPKSLLSGGSYLRTLAVPQFTSAILFFASWLFAADTQLIFPSDRVDEAFQGGAANYESFASDRPEYLAYRQAFIYLYQRNPNIPKERAIQLFETWRTRFIERYRPGDPSPPGKPGSGPARYDLFNGACDIAASLPGGDEIGLGFIISIVRQTKEFGDFRYHRQREEIYRISSLLKQGFTIEAEREYQRRADGATATLKRTNPNFAGFMAHLDADSARRTVEIVAAHPEWATLPTVQALRGLMNERGEIVASIEQLRALFGNELQNLQDTMNSNLALVTDLAARQDILYRYMLNAEEQRLNQERIAQEQAAYEQKVKAANASVYILSTLVGFDNPELGRQMQVVGNSTIQIADALHNFAKADALGSVILTGNILGAVMGVVSSFSAGGPSPDQQILEGIRQLQQMVHQLRVEMHARFDRVDAALNQIYTTMNDRFDRIDTTLGILRGDVEEIQQSLYNLQSDLYRIERKIFAFLDADSRFVLNEAINGALGYYDNFGQPIPYQGAIPSYIWAENRFSTWAVDNSRNELLSGSAGRGYDDASLYAELTSQPLENNLNYISQYLATKGWPAFATVRLANPRDWAIAANSWMELASESPMFFRQVSSNRLEQVYRVGLDLQRSVTNITLVQSNPLPVANRALFNALFANYRTKATPFKQRLGEKEEEFRLSISSDSLKREPLRALNLWGGPSQPTSYVPPLSGIPPRSGDLTHGITASLTVPPDWTYMVPATCFLGELIGAGTLNIGWGDYDLVNRQPRLNIGCSSGGHPLGGNVQIALKGGLDSDMCFYRRGVFGCPGNLNRLATVPDTPCANPTFDTWLRNLLVAWDRDPEFPQVGWHYDIFFVRGAQSCGPVSVDVPDVRVTNGLSSVTSRVDQKLRQLQRGSYNLALSSLSQATSLQAAANDLSGAKALLDSFIALGFPESLERDDFVHSFLSGGDRVLDTDAVRNLCQLGITRTYDTNQNAKLDIAAILDERINALETWVSNRLTQIETNGRAESLRIISSTLSRLDAFRAGWSQPTPAPYLAPLGIRLTNGVPNRLSTVWGEPNLRYIVQVSTNLTQWTDLPILVDEGQDLIITPTAHPSFYRAVLRP